MVSLFRSLQLTCPILPSVETMNGCYSPKLYSIRQNFKIRNTTQDHELHLICTTPRHNQVASTSMSTKTRQRRDKIGTL
ncbi:uncharacterized protein YALI1_C21272g [Yarrowia lipolytica]|uniref:Uncharacterized protein n=1 Tax=Yarrowia lipolytica TaxID=4952 RepID=A0A1D8NBA7_YARLL|nr:hypothetical protein YALI1_C21272g [Yarrowia lipolytica]